MSEWLAGKHAVLHALKAGKRRVERVYYAAHISGADINPFVELCRQKKISIEKKDISFISKNAPLETHQGLLARVSNFEYQDLEALIQSLQGKRKAALLVLDEIQDPHHVGALIRSASCFGLDGVVMSSAKASGVTATAAKTSSGAIEYIPVCRVTSIAKALDLLKENNFWVYGTAADGPQTLHGKPLDPRSVLVIGSEALGMKHLVRQKCDFLISIPIVGPISSLSASVAGSVIMAAWAKS